MKNITKAHIRWLGGNSGDYFLHKDKYGKIYIYDSVGNVNYDAGEVYIDTESVEIIEPCLEEVEDFIIQRLERTFERLENYPTDMSCWGNADQCFAANSVKEQFIEILKEELL